MNSGSASAFRAAAELPDREDEEARTDVPHQVKLEPGHTYKVKANISGVEKWHTVVRRPIDGKPGVYYVEEDFHDYYYEDDDWSSDDVRVLE
jgi:hypothetical protein